MSIKAATTLLAGLAFAALAWAQAPTASGEVIKIDRANARVTLKHGEIRHLDMPPMTMAYRVASSQLLDRVAVGDRVRFVAERVAGQYMVTALDRTP